MPTEVGKITILQARQEADLQDVKLSSAEADWVAVETADGLEAGGGNGLGEKGLSADDLITRESAVGQRIGRESADELSVSRLSADGQEMGDKSAVVVCEVESTTAPHSLAELESAALVNLEHVLAMNLDQQLDLDMPLEQAPDLDFKPASVPDLTETPGPALEEVAFNTGIYI
jgi:hypothetical protein